MQEPRDKGAYRLAIGAIGLALVVTLAGICLILAFAPDCDSGCSSQSPEIPSELWKVASALGGGLLGILAPPPTKRSKRGKPKKTADKTAPASETDPEPSPREKRRGTVGKEIGDNLTVLVLLVVFGASAAFGIAESSTGLQSLAAASGAALLGLLAPTPAHTESERADAFGTEH